MDSTRLVSVSMASTGIVLAGLRRDVCRAAHV